jgi:hypothetical protein
MTMFHAVLSIDHHNAQVLQFDAEHVEAQRIRAHSQHLRKHGSKDRSDSEFYAEVCDALQGIAEVLVVGSRTGLTDFKHYVEKHHAACSKQIVGYEAVNHPTEAELLAMARRYFQKYDLMAGTPTPV